MIMLIYVEENDISEMILYIMRFEVSIGNIITLTLAKFLLSDIDNADDL